MGQVIQRYAGIDPGQHGAVAVIDHYPDGTRVTTVQPIPTTDGEYDFLTLVDVLSKLSPSLTVIEKLGPQPSWGSKNFAFGISAITPVYACRVAGVPYVRATPKAWRDAILPGTAKDKTAALRHVRDAYPDLVALDVESGEWIKPKKITHDAAEAVCMAEYAAFLRGVGASQTTNQGKA